MLLLSRLLLLINHFNFESSSISFLLFPIQLIQYPLQLLLIHIFPTPNSSAPLNIHILRLGSPLTSPLPTLPLPPKIKLPERARPAINQFAAGALRVEFAHELAPSTTSTHLPPPLNHPLHLLLHDPVEKLLVVRGKGYAGGGLFRGRGW